MIDLHCHLLPGIDDGADTLDTSLRMARAYADEGVTAVVCTPHILPGLYHNTGPQIRSAVSVMQRALRDHGVPLDLYCGSDAHIAIDFEQKLKRGEILTLAGSRYVLIEIPQHAGPKLLETFFFRLRIAGYVPVLSHPERLPWIESQYGVIERLVASGVWLQLTSGSLLGHFGRSAKYWSERMLEDGLVHLLATDAHDVWRRSPNLARGRDAAAKLVGDHEAGNLVGSRPMAVLRDDDPSRVPALPQRLVHNENQKYLT